VSNLAVCLPCYDGRVSLRWMSAYMRTRDLLTKQNIKMEFLCVVDCGIIQFARAGLVAQALQTEAEQILFVDGKQIWEPVGVLRLLEDLKMVDIIAAPAVCEKGKFYANYATDDDGNEITKNHLKKATHSSVAFMGLNRHVLEGMCEKYPELEYESDGVKHFDLFDNMLEDKKFIGEDTAFSLRTIRAGYDIWIDEGIRVMRYK
jgi:hypothetical protein